jgi:hypothetical protein
MRFTILLDHWRGLADPARMQAALEGTGPWRAYPYEAQTHDAVYGWLAQRFLNAEARVLAALMTDDESGRYSFEATPCYWMISRDDMQVTTTPQPTLSESEALVDAANDALDGAARIELVSATYWSFRTRFDLACPAFSQALGKQVQAVLPVGDTTRAFKRALNNVQMAWHAHPVNQAREACGALPINALWIYGGQPKKATLPLPFNAVLDCGLRSQLLARATGAPLVNHIVAKHTLVWLTDGREAIHHGADLAASAYERLAHVLAQVPRDAAIELLATDAAGYTRAERALPRNIFKRWLAGFLLPMRWRSSCWDQIRQ